MGGVAMIGAPVWLEVEVDGESERMTLGRFVSENEASPQVVALAKALTVGEGMTLSAGEIKVRRVAAPTKSPSRWARMSLPWNFDRSTVVKVAIHRDTGTVMFRPRGRRSVSYVDLGKLLEVVASREAKAAALAKKRARRSRK